MLFCLNMRDTQIQLALSYSCDEPQSKQDETDEHKK